MTNWLRKMGIYFWVILLLVCAVRAVSAVVKSTFLSSRIMHYLDRHPEADTIRLSDFTHREWDYIFIYTYKSNRDEFAEVLGMSKEDLDTKPGYKWLFPWERSGFALISDGKLVYRESYRPNGVSEKNTTDFLIYPYLDINSPPFCRVMSKEEAVFWVGRSKETFNTFYSLWPNYDPDVQQFFHSDEE